MVNYRYLPSFVVDKIKAVKITHKIVSLRIEDLGYCYTADSIFQKPYKLVKLVAKGKTYGMIAEYNFII